MMDLLLATSGSEAQAAGGGYVDDVFSAYTYTGNGATQTINNGIDLAGKGGMVWTKCRDSTNAHELVNTVRGNSASLNSASTSAESALSEITSFTSSGYTLGYISGNGNIPNNKFVSWTFRRAPKFFDVVTYTGNGVAGRQIPHSLGVAPGMIIVKATSAADNWVVYHRSLGATKVTRLNETIAAQDWGLTTWSNSEPTSTVFSLGTNVGVNGNGVSYVAYLFAHDPSAEGIIQCGSFTTDGSGNATVNLGWEPQWLLTKSSTNGAFDTGWFLFDVQRGWPAKGGPVTKYLLANSSDVELGGGDWNVNSTGFSFGGRVASTPFIYLAIRRPNKPPTTGTEVYNAIARTGTGAAATVTGVGFAPDLHIAGGRGTNYSVFSDRLRGATRYLRAMYTQVETADAQTVTAFNMDGISLGSDSNGLSVNNSGQNIINWFFRRAKGFFDVVCYTGTGVARTVAHNLGVAPELMIVKCRGLSLPWAVGTQFGASRYTFLTLNTIDAAYPTTEGADYTASTGPNFNNGFGGAPTALTFSIDGTSLTNNDTRTYVAYLFASLPGISKVGSYTGNGTSQTINCGFATGARFILIKRTDATGDWYVWDSVRGIIAANDPHLSLNTTAAEVTTDDSVDPAASGFIVNQNTATNINVSGGQYIFLAIA